MKLFTRYVRLNLLAMLIVFAVSMGALYFTFRYILVEQLDEMLEVEQEENLHYIRKNQALQPIVSTSDQIITYVPVSTPGRRGFSTVALQGDEGLEDFRKLSFPVYFEGRNYLYSVAVPLEHTEYLLRAMALVTLVTIALMLSLIYLINRNLVRNILRPFYDTIDAVSRYSLSRRTPLQLPQTPIEEFTALNRTLNGLTERAQKDYQLVRDFTAHAAHEMQTPLTVMRTKLESLMQTPDISEEQAEQITGVDNSVERMTRLFNALLLLTKIENHQFAMNKEVEIDKIVSEKLEELSELAPAGTITIVSHIEAARLCCSDYLADVLIGNLLNNAIRYNFPGGTIEVELKPHSLTISNTSELPGLEGDSLFRPFYRHPDSKQDGNGLGLSIVKQICEVCGIVIEYTWKNGLHRFTLVF